MKRNTFHWAKGVATIVVVFFAALSIMTLFLVCSSKVPRSAIQTKMEESAEFISRSSQIEYALPGVLGTQIHYTADTIWLSIAYGFETERPLETTIWSNFYREDAKDVCKSFAVQVQTQQTGNTQYLRYWHGAAAILRFLHLFFNVRQIYIFHSFIMAVLIIGLLILLCRYGLRGEAAALAISLLMVSIWVVPMCLEYTWVFFVMSIVSIIAVSLANKERYEHISVVFLLTGMVTVYLDFLTTELLTLLIPLLLIIRIYSRNHSESKPLWYMSIKASLSWLIGYCLMWSMKWVISSLILHQNVMPFVREHIEERLNGSVGLSLPEFLLEAVLRNIQRLAFYDYGIYGAVAVFILIVAVLLPVFTNRMKLREKFNRSRIGLYAILMLIPYVRYLVLHNHSYGHYCFTFRTQAASILALCFIVFECVEPISKKAVKQNA